jgi:small subunit ribosomal protein S3
MSQKVNHVVFRLPIRRAWRCRWLVHSKCFSKFLVDNYKIRRFTETKLKHISIARIDIERSDDKVPVNLSSPRPGIIIRVKSTELDKFTRE